MIQITQNNKDYKKHKVILEEKDFNTKIEVGRGR